MKPSTVEKSQGLPNVREDKEQEGVATPKKRFNTFVEMRRNEEQEEAASLRNRDVNFMESGSAEDDGGEEVDLDAIENAGGVESDEEFEENNYSGEALRRLASVATPCQCPEEEPRCGQECSNRREKRECSRGQHAGREGGACSNMVSAN